MSQRKKKTLKKRNKYHRDNASLKDIDEDLGKIDEILIKTLKERINLADEDNTSLGKQYGVVQEECAECKCWDEVFASIIKDWNQIVKSGKLYEGYYEIITTLLVKEGDIEILKLEDELDKGNKVQFNNDRLF